LRRGDVDLRPGGSAARVPEAGARAVVIERAFELAERGRGTTAPNPVVGAVVVRNGQIVGEGWHERKGGPHAEVVALEAAGRLARGSTLYVTMEPCAHHGSTPPCTEAVLESGGSWPARSIRILMPAVGSSYCAKPASKPSMRIPSRRASRTRRGGCGSP